MADGDSGYKWWIRFVLIPLVGGGGAVALVVAYVNRPGLTTTESRIATTSPAVTELPHGSKPPAAPPRPDATSDAPAPPSSTQPTGNPPDRSAASVAAMEWIESRCGSRIELLVPTSPGSSLDQAARSFATALSGSGVKPVPIVTSRPGVFMANGAFSVQKFDDWQRTHTAKEGCLLMFVPGEVREQFALPRFDATVADKAYGIVLPRGLLSDVAARWNTVFVKASQDPDFVREVSRVGLKVDVVPL